MVEGQTLNAYHGKIARLIVQPEDGDAAVIDLIRSAERSIQLKMFEMTRGAIIEALIHAKTRGVAVEVLLNQHRSSGLRPNDDTMQTLREAGVPAQWASARLAVTHEKSMLIDGERLLIATFNFSDKYFGKTRDYGLLIEDDKLIAEVDSCFKADKASAPFEPPSPSPLAWGNRTARTTVAAFIDAAQETLWLQHPKFRDAAILERVLKARHRGVKVRFLCGGTHGIEPPDLIATISYQRILAHCGVHLRRQRHLKLHTKLMIADETLAMLGSMNIDRDGFDIRRELGLVFDDKATVAALTKGFEADWHEGKIWEPPDPLSFEIHAAVDAEPDPCPEIRHD